MAEMTDKYQGVELFDAEDEKIGTVSGMLTDDNLHQFYVVETGGLLGFKKTRYYVPAEAGVATGSQRLDAEVTKDQIDDLGWDRPPAAS